MTRRVHLLAYRLVASQLPRSTAPGGRFWRALRLWCARPLLLSCGSHVNVERGATFASGQVSIGDHSGIGVDAYLQGPVAIGKHVMMAPQVVIFTANHIFASRTVPMRLQGSTEARPVVIEDDVWLGQRCMVMPGLRIGRGAVVAAGAIVTKDVPQFAVVAGNPARVVGERP